MIAALAGAMLAIALPAHAQEDMPELDGGPPPLRVPKAEPPRKAEPPKPAPKPSAPATTNAAAQSRLKAEEDRLTRQADAQKAEATRLAALAADLRSQQARLDARATALAAEEDRLARQRADQEADYAKKVADLDRQRAAIPSRQVADAAPAAPLPRTRQQQRILFTYDEARRACTQAGMSEAIDRDFYSARYDGAPHFFEAERELRGVMRMQDRRGFLLVDTVCELDRDGEVIDFALLR